VYTYPVTMNVTVALDDELVARAREMAARQGTTLNDLLRQYLESVAGHRPASVLVGELQRLWDDVPGRSGGRRISRDEAYEGRIP
jgi:hypothetical protein